MCGPRAAEVYGRLDGPLLPCPRCHVTRPTPPDARPAVTLYVPSHNYGHWLGQAVDSVFAQSFPDWELILFDDGSTDDTLEICEAARARAPERVQIVHHPTPRGLFRCANQALTMARGRYFMRLDADDWLDESALLVMVDYLERNPDAALVYPNYWYVDADGRYLGVEHRKRAGDEAKMLDLPAHGACTMVRRRVLKAVGGYDEAHDAQDGHELWLKVFSRYRVGDVTAPLFFYRQHGTSLSRNEERLLNARARIQRTLRAREEQGVRPRTLAVVPAKNTYSHLPNVVLRQLAGRPLIDHTLDVAIDSGAFDHVCVTTDDEAVVAHCRERGDVTAFLRPAELSASDRRLSEIFNDAVLRMENDHDVWPDIVVMLSVHSPLRGTAEIIHAIDNLVLYQADSVISVYEDHDLHLVHGEHGLRALNPAMEQRIRLEREGLYTDNGAITVTWRDTLDPSARYVGRLSHVVMPRERSFQIKNEFDAWMAEQILLRANKEAQ